MVSSTTIGALLVKLKLTGAEKYQADLRRVEERTTRSSSRITDFLKKWRLAYASIITAAVAAFYGVARVSPSLDTQMSRLRIAFEYLGMVIGEKLAPYFEPITRWQEEAVYNTADWVDKLNLGLLPALSEAAEKTREYGKSIKEVSGWQGLFARPFGDLQTPLAGFVLAYQAVLNRLVELTGEKLRPLHERLSEAWNRIIERAHEKWNEISSIPASMIEKAVFKVTGWVSNLKTNLEKWWERIRTGASRAWNKIKDAIWQPIRDAYHKVSYYVGLILTKLENVPGIGGLISAGRERFGGAGAGSTTNTTNQQISVNVEGGKEWTDEDWVQRISERILDELARRSGV
ncbi:MAG: hypothetical protein ACXQS6_01530 [Candidatus Syntropharchaeales archaeon]